MSQPTRRGFNLRAVTQIRENDRQIRRSMRRNQASSAGPSLRGRNRRCRQRRMTCPYSWKPRRDEERDRSVQRAIAAARIGLSPKGRVATGNSSRGVEPGQSSARTRRVSRPKSCPASLGYRCRSSRAKPGWADATSSSSGRADSFRTRCTGMRSRAFPGRIHIATNRPLSNGSLSRWLAWMASNRSLV
jgi:hypothetical protein